MRPWRLAVETMFNAFLVIVCAITLVRVMILMVALFAPPERALPSMEHVLGLRVEPDALATAALARALPSEGSFNVPNAIARGDVRRLLRMANARFNYRWGLLRAHVVATQGLVRLTLLVSFAYTCYRVYPAFAFHFNDTNRPAYSAWYLAGRELLTQLAIGLAVCIALAAVHAFFEARLIRRKASWRLFHATALNALSRRGPDAVSGPR
jgi:hypothetical protein